ncbi:outer membrane beta-barrel protein [Gemmatimonas phototrophica]|uniref:outer membrane beta-barrel protein n=1 Tax=Gemmatimonas phototrophica TaxID=1379270 RepID=UPI001314391B|nr:outer membrane beta-barrel protein [Gemmatimonas phototrophica]
MRRRALLAAAALLTAAPGSFLAQAVSPPPADSTLRVSMGGFLDTYLAWDTGRPRSLDRGYTTQAVRHGEFNVNLAFLDATLTAPRVRGRLALQAGTSVQANYAGEPRTGQVSGPELARLLQEAYAGFAVRPDLWVDAGVFYSNVGMEGWVSRDNLTYTRSLVADFSPYYSAGLRATWQATSRLTARIDLINGWQIISENNEAKTLGARLDYALSPASKVSWYALAGHEPGVGLRAFNGLGFSTRRANGLELSGQVDLGTQQRDDSITMAPQRNRWYGTMLTARLPINRSVSLTGRVERFVDEEQAVVVTPVTQGMRANGASVGLDARLASLLMWRSEARLLRADADIFPDRRAANERSRNNALLVTSLAVTF